MLDLVVAHRVANAVGNGHAQRHVEGSQNGTAFRAQRSLRRHEPFEIGFEHVARIAAAGVYPTDFGPIGDPHPLQRCCDDGLRRPKRVIEAAFADIGSLADRVGGNRVIALAPEQFGCGHDDAIRAATEPDGSRCATVRTMD